MKLNLLVISFLSIFLIKCSPSGGGSSKQILLVGDPPDATILNPLVLSSNKIMQFSWSAVSDADYYQLEEALDGITYADLGEQVTGTSVDQLVFLPTHLSAKFRIKACNTSGCTSSNEVTVSSSLNSSIGYFKASNTNAGDGFGEKVAISADGRTLAVTARFEGSNAVGVDGDQTDNSDASSGAIYIFYRSGSVWAQQAYIKASNTEAGDEFGQALSLSADGNTLAAGTFNEDSKIGRAHV